MGGAGVWGGGMGRVLFSFFSFLFYQNVIDNVYNQLLLQVAPAFFFCISTVSAIFSFSGALFPLDRAGIVESCDSGRFWLIF